MALSITVPFSQVLHNYAKRKAYENNNADTFFLINTRGKDLINYDDYNNDIIFIITMKLNLEQKLVARFSYPRAYYCRI